MRGTRRAPIPLPGDARAALRPDRRVLANLTAEGAITLSDGVPETVTVERPRQKGHGDYATNVALQLAKQAGMHAARARRPGRRAAEPRRRHRRRRGRRARASSTSRSTAGAQGAVADDVVAAGRGVRRLRRLAQKQKVNVEFVSANPTGPVTLGQRPLGRGRRHPRAAARGQRLPGHAGVLLQRPRRPDRPVQPVAAGGGARAEPTPEDGYPGSTSPRSPQQVVARASGGAGSARRRGAGGFRKYGVGMMFEEIKQTLADFRVPFDVYFHENDLYESAAPPSGRSRGCASSATSTRRTARCGCAPSSSATTRTA